MTAPPRMDPLTLARLLGVHLAETNSEIPNSTAGAAAAAEPVDLTLYPLVQAALDKNTGDRSEDTMRVVGACYDVGLTLAQTRSAVGTRPDLAGRLAERDDDDVLTCWLKATDKRQNIKFVDPGAINSSANSAESQDKPSETPAGMPRLWRAADLKPAGQQRWLAKGRLLRAAINLLIGDEGIGKSLLWVWITAAFTTGKPLPEFGIPAREPAHVVIVVTEDDWATTVHHDSSSPAPTSTWSR